MSTSIVGQPNSSVKPVVRSVVRRKPRKDGSPEPTAEERAARVEEFHNLTQVEYVHLRNYVRKVVPRYLCDPEEALAQGLLAANRKYDGRVKLTTYVGKCALYYSFKVRDQRSRYLPFTEQPADEHQDEHATFLENTLAADEPCLVESVDAHFIQRIHELLDCGIDSRSGFPQRPVIALAHQILDVLCANANLSKGIGVDEYDDAPLKKPRWKNTLRVSRNTREPRGRIEGNLAERLGTSSDSIKRAMICLRQSTRQAMSEGGLTD